MACITLLSDFGLQEASVAIAKGVLMQHNPDLTIVDISHEVKQFYTAQAAYLLSAAWHHFPSGTCHILLFDLFSEKTVSVLVAEMDGQYFISADSGLLPAALPTPPETWIFKELSPAETYIDWLHAASKVINQLQGSDMEVMNLQPFKPRNAKQNRPLETGDTIKCDVIHIDRYENVVLNITREQFESIGKGRPFRLEYVQVEEITELSNTYADVKPGQKLCRFNSNGYLEICVNRGNAASLFGLKLGGMKNEIKITFG